jgi:hypothetical protein
MSSPFNVQINPGENQASSTVTVTGSDQHIITENERGLFGITDSPLKDAVGKYFGKPPKDAYVESPTPWNDLYSTYGWPQVQITVRPISSSILKWTSQPLIVATQKFLNSSTKAGDFNVSISEQQANTTESNWSVTKTVDVTQTINYGIQFLGAGGGGSTSLSYSQAWGKGGSQSQTTTLGSSQAVTVNLAPGQSVLAQLSASKGTMVVQVVYEATLSGSTAVNYYPTYQGHHFWSFDINRVMQSGGIPQSIQYTDELTVDYYMDSTVQLLDQTGQPVTALLATAATAESLSGVAVEA